MQAKDERKTTVARKLFPYSRDSFITQEAGTSTQRQQDMIRAVATEYDATIDDSYALNDRGVSGYTGKNVKKKLGLFIRLCEEGIVRKGDILCIERVNRLSRMIWTEQVKLWERILSFGVEIVTCEPREHYTAKSIGKLAKGCPLAIQMMQSHESSQEKSDWIKYAHKVSRERAMAEGVPHGKRCPGWLRPVGRPHPLNQKRRITERWEPIPERVAIIKRIHQMAWDGDGIDEIEKRLLAEGVPHWSRRGTWTAGAVEHAIKSRALIGWCVPNDDLYKDGRLKPASYRNYPSILTDEEYERTQLALAGRRKKGGRKCVWQFNLFTGLIRTLEGAPIHRRYFIGHKGRRYHYLAPKPITFRVPYQLVEDTFLAMLQKLKPSDIDGSLRPDQWTDRITQLQARAAELREKIDALTRKLKKLPVEEWPDEFVETMQEWKDEEKANKRELDEAKLYGSTSGRVETLADTQSILSYLNGLTDPAERQGALERLKVRLPVLLEGITLAIDGVRGRSKWVHLKIAYKGGHVDAKSIRIGNPDPPTMTGFMDEMDEHFKQHRKTCEGCGHLNAILPEA